MEPDRNKKSLLILIIISAAVRILISSITELGNDEVYYWTYALQPALSYFDHPPLIAVLIRITTLNMLLNNEIFVRLGAIIFGSLNIWLIYKTGTYLKDSKTGFYASLLYTASLYGSVITGIFILPDTPQSFFWIFSVYFLLRSVVNSPAETGSKKYILLSGITIGLGMLAKYHAAFLWLGAIIYIIMYNRRWLRCKELYISLLISAALFLPVIIWNIENNFISFTFHSGRVSIFSSEIHPEYFFREIAGQIFYNNPVNFVLIITALIFLTGNKIKINPGYKRFLLLTGLPIILLFIIFSFTRPTLPHWSAPGYFSLIILTALFISSSSRKKIFNIAVTISLLLTASVLIIGILIVNYGLIDLSRLGGKDVTLEMFGWQQIGNGFRKVSRKHEESGDMKKNAPIVSRIWYEAAHLEYYAAYPDGRDIYALGSVSDIRNYYFQNKKIDKKTDCYYITTSNDFISPADIFNEMALQIRGPDTLKIFRNGAIAELAFLYRLYDFNIK